jgi:hypothetical protein
MKFRCTSKHELLQKTEKEGEEKKVYEYEFASEENGPMKLGCFQSELFEVGEEYEFGEFPLNPLAR